MNTINTNKLKANRTLFSVFIAVCIILIIVLILLILFLNKQQPTGNNYVSNSITSYPISTPVSYPTNSTNSSVKGKVFDFTFTYNPSLGKTIDKTQRFNSKDYPNGIFCTTEAISFTKSIITIELYKGQSDGCYPASGGTIVGTTNIISSDGKIFKLAIYHDKESNLNGTIIPATDFIIANYCFNDGQATCMIINANTSGSANSDYKIVKLDQSQMNALKDQMIEIIKTIRLKNDLISSNFDKVYQSP